MPIFIPNNKSGRQLVHFLHNHLAGEYDYITAEDIRKKLEDTIGISAEDYSEEFHKTNKDDYLYGMSFNCDSDEENLYVSFIFDTPGEYGE